MTKFQLTLLGTNAATPAFGRITSCQILNYNESLVLIDCGEACQIRLNQYKIKRSKIDIICISHLHGDHIFGLPGLLTSYNLHDRKSPLTIFGPVGIKFYIEQVMIACQGKFIFPIEIIELDHEGIKEIGQLGALQITAFPMKHRIKTYGYRFDEKIPPRNIRKEAIKKYALSIAEIKQVKSGKTIEREGSEVDLNELCFSQKAARSYAYCSDTIYDLDLVQYIKGVDYLYHETTYTKELAIQAEERMHATAEQAATIAKSAGVGHLITGHYSGRYRDPKPLLIEAKAVFARSLMGYDGMIINL